MIYDVIKRGWGGVSAKTAAETSGTLRSRNLEKKLIVCFFFFFSWVSLGEALVKEMRCINDRMISHG